ncbi:type II CAAX prenyl endopeptidase Rce1 family protein [Photobacterium aphoticum]|uniref:CPBP family intramembrane glutamic endopeptidase n=2 Tax=Photobacterium aphoticum TaxID=754436 RepID=UPI000D166C5B|nr:CPBP family intramembrane metalloprotease [Photobacterium aphoticum]GHA53517.1 hypothetical protein GCM10007086_29790 [Photobacterium aphoticum]
MKHKSVYLMLAVIISTMGTFIVINALSNFTGFMVYLGFTPDGSGTLISWILAFIVTVLYCYSAAKNSDVKRYMFKLDVLKCISIVAAVCAGIVEEVVFRKWVMDYLDSEGFSIFIQIFASGVAFSVVHVIWGIKSIKAGVNAAISTFLLGLALGAIQGESMNAHFSPTVLKPASKTFSR